MENEKYTTPEEAYSQMMTSSGKKDTTATQSKTNTPEQSRERMIERHRRTGKTE